MNRSVRCFVATVLVAFCVGAVAAQPDPAYQQLNHALDQLAADPVLGQYALGERQLARQAVEHLRDVRRKDREHALYMARKRVDLAKASAELDESRHKLGQLAQERNTILLEASRRDASATRRALERERLQNQLAAEQTQQLMEQGQALSQSAAEARKLAQSKARAAAAARHEADLAEQAVRLMREQLDHLTAKPGSEGMQMTLGGIAFAPGQTSLRPGAQAHLGKLVKFVQSQPDKAIRIEGYTDSSGNAAVNQTLSLQRAQSVARALEAKGVAASRITTVGKGETNPIASNDTAEGRAKNRRVVVILKGG